MEILICRASSYVRVCNQDLMDSGRGEIWIGINGKCRE
jgi:hypothetical protein